MKKKLSLLLLVILSITSCKKDDDDPVIISGTPGYNGKGIFVVNEGGFGNGNGSISYFRIDSSYQDPNIYYNVNNAALGDIVQSMNIFNGKGYIVINNSQKVEIVNMSDFKHSAVINGFASPRYFLGINSTTAYVSDWTNNNIKIINLNSNTISGSIPCGSGPDQMIRINNKVFVCNVGGFDTDSSITVIDVNSNLVLSTIHVGVNPNSIHEDSNGKVWILCGGTLGPDFAPGTIDDIGGQLLQIDPDTYTVLKQFNFGQGDHPVKMTMNSTKNKIYYLGGNSTYTGLAYRMNISDNNLPSSALINRELYGLGVDPLNENIYGGIGNFSISTYALHYSADGIIIDSTKAGIGSNGFIFNY